MNQLAKRSQIRLVTLIIIVASFASSRPLTAAAQAAPITYENPLAYIGADGNLYITNVEGTHATAVTSSTSAPDSAPHWSPQGTQLVFEGRSQYDENSGSVKETLFRIDSGGPPTGLVENIDMGHLAL